MGSLKNVVAELDDLASPVHIVTQTVTGLEEVGHITRSAASFKADHTAHAAPFVINFQSWIQVECQ
jgi:hypothetical protein